MGNVKALQKTIWSPAHDGGHFATLQEKLLKPSLVGTFVKYKYVVFANNNYRRKFLVHRLVYEAFKGKIPKGYTIDHRDNDSLNNRIDNLQCVTQKENIIKSNNHSKRNKSSYLVIDTETGKEQKFISSTEAGKFLSVTGTHVRTTAKNKSTTKLICGKYKVMQIPFLESQ